MSDAAAVLAAGKGTRMRSSLPKVLHPLAGKPMIVRVLGALDAAGFHAPVLVVGYGADQIKQRLGDGYPYVDQREQLGTGHAARVALAAVPASTDRLLLVHGDEPLVPGTVYGQMLDEQRKTGAPAVILTTRTPDARGFGRVVRGDDGRPVALAQEADLTPDQLGIDEVNLGAYVFDVAVLRSALAMLAPHPPKGELYLTDVVAWLAERGSPAAAVEIDGGLEVMGVNDRVQLEQAGQAIYRATNRRLMESGVTITDSATTFIDDSVRIGEDTVILPFTVIAGDTSIGALCEIGPRSHLDSSTVGDRVRVAASTVEGAWVADDVVIGPYSHLRPGARVESGAEIGNYAEIKNSTIGSGTKMHHMSYVGDARIGVNVNIGAGVVTCNYDGRRKHVTTIGDNAFIGSDTMLRAPVTVGAGAYTGAGAVVTRDVPAGTVAAGVPARVTRRLDEQTEAGSES